MIRKRRRSATRRVPGKASEMQSFCPAPTPHSALVSGNYAGAFEEEISFGEGKVPVPSEEEDQMETAKSLVLLSGAQPVKFQSIPPKQLSPSLYTDQFKFDQSPRAMAISPIKENAEIIRPKRVLRSANLAVGSMNSLPALDILPLVLWFRILSMIPPSLFLFRLSRVCKAWRIILYSESFNWKMWRQFFGDAKPIASTGTPILFLSRTEAENDSLTETPHPDTVDCRVNMMSALEKMMERMYLFLRVSGDEGNKLLLRGGGYNFVELWHREKERDREREEVERNKRVNQQANQNYKRNLKKRKGETVDYFSEDEKYKMSTKRRENLEAASKYLGGNKVEIIDIRKEKEVKCSLALRLHTLAKECIETCDDFVQLLAWAAFHGHIRLMATTCGNPAQSRVAMESRKFLVEYSEKNPRQEYIISLLSLADMESTAQIMTQSFNSKFSAFHLAAMEAAPRMMKALLTISNGELPGGDPRLTPLHWCCWRDTLPKARLEVAQILLEAGADPSALSTSGSDAVTPLCLAARNGLHKICALLVEYGAKVNEMCSDEGTALHVALGMFLIGQLEPEQIVQLKSVVKVLIKCGANIHTQNSQGITPTSMAETIQDKELLQLLQGYSKV